MQFTQEIDFYYEQIYDIFMELEEEYPQVPTDKKLFDTIIQKIEELELFVPRNKEQLLTRIKEEDIRNLVVTGVYTHYYEVDSVCVIEYKLPEDKSNSFIYKVVVSGWQEYKSYHD